MAIKNFKKKVFGMPIFSHFMKWNWRPLSSHFEAGEDIVTKCIMVESSIPPSVFNLCKPLVGPFLDWTLLSSACNMVSFGRNWPIKVKLWVIENEATKCPYGPWPGTFPKWGTNPICYKGKSPFYRAISLGTILVGMKLPVNPATWLWAMIELRCLWTVCILGQ